MLGITTGLKLLLDLRQIHHVVKHREKVPAAFSASIELTNHQNAADYTVTKTRLAMLNTITDSLILLWLTLGGGINWLWVFISTLTTSEIIRGTLFTCIVILITVLASLPFSLYSTFNIEARFGFNKTTLSLFLTDTLKTVLLAVLIGIPLLVLILWIMDSMGSLWWIWAWTAWAGFNLLLLIIFPTFIAPLFNKFQPLEDDTLRSKIETLLSRNGFASKGVFVMDGSKRSSHSNAYFTGFGRSKRIVFFDTLLKQLTPEQIEAVLAHELGHFHLKHITKRMVLSFTLSLTLLFVLGHLMTIPWFYSGLGVTYQSTSIALILFFMVIPIFTFPLTPLSSYLSRQHEYEADKFAATQNDAKELITALTILYKDNASTLTPDPLYSMFYNSHPPASLRIASLERFIN